jgi:hypothetical protein
MNTSTASGWRTRQSAALADETRAAVEACLDSLAATETETPTPPAIVPPDWEDLVAGRLRQCHLPGGVLERLIAEAVADTMSAMAATLERQLRFRIQREQRAHLQTCDDY